MSFVSKSLPAFIFMSVAGCSGLNSQSVSLGPSDAGQAVDTAVRTMPVVAGRPARVFIFAGLGDKCEPLAAPEITITGPPAKGDVTFVPGQETTIAYPAQGTCTGRKSTGTGVYYTARAGEAGADRFSVSAKLASGESAVRMFEVRIAE